MSADLHAAALAAIAARRALIEPGTPGPWEAHQNWLELGVPDNSQDIRSAGPESAIGSIYMHYTNKGANGALIVAAVNAFARDTDALEAVLERHAPDPMEDEGISLVHCAVCTSFTGQAPWPCPDARAALTALGVEG